jgi:ribonuclease PH
VAAISCGIYAGTPLVDLDYLEDSDAGVDANFVMSSDMKLIEIQGSAEGARFSRDEFNKLMDLAEKGVATLINAQKQAIN